MDRERRMVLRIGDKGPGGGRLVRIVVVLGFRRFGEKKKLKNKGGYDGERCGGRRSFVGRRRGGERTTM